MWLQELTEKGLVIVRKVPRALNVADLMTHVPSANDLKQHMPAIGLFEANFAKTPLEKVITALVPGGPSSKMSTKALMQAALLVTSLERSSIVERSS